MMRRGKSCLTAMLLWMDGSFVLAGYPAAVINIGSFPDGDPNCHAEGDVPETCDIENTALVQATLAAVVTTERDLRTACPDGSVHPKDSAKKSVCFAVRPFLVGGRRPTDHMGV